MAQAPRFHPYHPDNPKLTALESELLSLYAHISAATYRFLVLLNEFDQANGWHGDGVKSFAHWLNWRCNIGMNAAREKIRVAKALPELPRISAAFEVGRLSYSKVRALTRVATPENEERSLHLALSSTAAQTERIVRGLRRCASIDEANAIERGRRLSIFVDDDGSCVIRGRLSAEAGALLMRALDEAREPIPDDDACDTPDEPHAASRADALGRLAESFIAGHRERLRCDERHTAMIHVNPEALRKRSKDVSAQTRPAPMAKTADGAPLSTETARRLCCDASLIAVYETVSGVPLSIGRRSRTIPSAIRRALSLRDDGCRFPGCTEKRHVDAHHIHHWADGGETALDNLVTLCRRHHRAVHEEGFSVVMTDKGPRFYSPDGTELLPGGNRSGQRRFRGNANGLRRHLPRGIGPGSLVPNWDGQRLDLGAAVEAVLAPNRPGP